VHSINRFSVALRGYSNLPSRRSSCHHEALFVRSVRSVSIRNLQVTQQHNFFRLLELMFKGFCQLFGSHSRSLPQFGSNDGNESCPRHRNMHSRNFPTLIIVTSIPAFRWMVLFDFGKSAKSGAVMHADLLGIGTGKSRDHQEWLEYRICASLFV